MTEELTPWNCHDEGVRLLWEQLTCPENENALVEWLSMIPPGQDETWTCEAVLECRRRKASR